MTVISGVQRGVGRTSLLAGAIWCFGLGAELPAHAQAPTPAPVPPSCGVNEAWLTAPSLPGEVSGGGMTNFSLHQFASQTFIDLVQPVSGQPARRTFETYMPDYGIFVAPGVPVTPWGQSPSAPCGTSAGQRSTKLFARPRGPKGAGFDPDSDHQAGILGGAPGSPL